MFYFLGHNYIMINFYLRSKLSFYFLSLSLFLSLSGSCMTDEVHKLTMDHERVKCDLQNKIHELERQLNIQRQVLSIQEIFLMHLKKYQFANCSKNKNNALGYCIMQGIIFYCIINVTDSPNLHLLYYTTFQWNNNIQCLQKQ